MLDFDLTELVKGLIEKGREGAYWDFKSKHHRNKAELIHDTLCLANSLTTGKRFLIFGVDDSNYQISGVPPEDRRTQADLVQFFRSNSAKFEGHRTPEITLRTVTVNGKDIDVLIIEDLPVKPYRLLEIYEHEGKKALPSIYCRQEDSNTPIDRSASSQDVDSMFRQRFRIDLSPLERLKFLLSDYQHWTSWENDVHYHEMHPEFTFKYDGDSEATDEEWLRGEIGYRLPEGNISTKVSFFYFGTMIGKIGYTIFDNRKKRVARPDWAPYKGGRVYFYPENSLSLSFQTHISEKEGVDFSKGIASPINFKFFNLPILSKDAQEALWGAEKSEVLRDHHQQNKVFVEGMEVLGAFKQASH